MRLFAALRACLIDLVEFYAAVTPAVTKPLNYPYPTAFSMETSDVTFCWKRDIFAASTYASQQFRVYEAEVQDVKTRVDKPEIVYS